MSEREREVPDTQRTGTLQAWAVKPAGSVAVLALGLMVALPVLPLLFKPFGIEVSYADWIQHLMLWVGLFGAVLASLKDRHLSIAIGEAVRSSRWKDRFEILSRGGTVGILLCLALASGQYILRMGGFGPDVGGWLPFWAALLPLPFAFVAMAVATGLHIGRGWRPRALTGLVALLVGPALLFIPVGDGSAVRVLGIGLLCALAAAGMPLFAALGGVSLLLFFLSDSPVAAIAEGIYKISTEFALPSIPLFALVGVVLARGKGPDRLVRLFRAWTGWLPGGPSVVAILGCAFFTAITGASGVTILALGGLLFPVLLAAHHGERFSLGLLTSSGSVGLLFFPSLPVILYAVRGQVWFVELFIAGFLPGVLLLVLLGGFSLLHARHQRIERVRFDFREAMAATRLAWGDVLLPILIVVAVGRLTNIVGASALAALWAIILEVGIHKNLGLKRDVPAAFVETCFLVGALVAVITVAFGLFEYLTTYGISDRIAEWVATVIHSRWAFLLVLNLLLLVVGALMDIFSAIILVVPIIMPLAATFGVSMTHLGIVFLANLELGYLTPPVGMNLFLSALTFDRPLLKIWRATLPFLGIVAVWVLLVTYLPWLSEGFAGWVLSP